jgi:hypothetical protein
MRTGADGIVKCHVVQMLTINNIMHTSVHTIVAGVCICVHAHAWPFPALPGYLCCTLYHEIFG